MNTTMTATTKAGIAADKAIAEAKAALKVAYESAEAEGNGVAMGNIEEVYYLLNEATTKLALV